MHVPFFQVPKSMGLPDPPKIEENKKADMAVTNHVFWSGSYSDVPNRPILAKPTPESRCQKRLFAWLLLSLFSPLAVACIGRSLATAGLHVGLVHASANHTLIDVLCQVSCVFGTCLRGGFIFWLLLYDDAWEKGFSRLSPLASPRSLFPFSFAHTLLVLLAEARREPCNCRWSLGFFGFLHSNSAFPCIVCFWEGWNSVARMMLEEFFCFCFPFWSLQLPRFVFLLCGVSFSGYFFFSICFWKCLCIGEQQTNKQTSTAIYNNTSIDIESAGSENCSSCAGKRPGSIGSSGIVGHLIAFCFLFFKVFVC